MKLGVYGGTFDPIHLAHLILAEFACEKLDLTRLLFIPSYLPPHKLDANITPAKHRCKMLELAIKGNNRFELCDYEVARGGASYTVDTLEYVKNKYAIEKRDLFLLIGADNMGDFHRWKEPQRITEIAQVVVAGRSHFDSKNSRFASILLHSPIIEISASLIRENVRKGKSITYLTPPSVEEYIYSNRLYQ